jgi:hypothetical protein
MVRLTTHFHLDLPQVDHGGGRARGREGARDPSEVKRAIEGPGKDFGKSNFH